jgi:hypothetical protein
MTTVRGTAESIDTTNEDNEIPSWLTMTAGMSTFSEVKRTLVVMEVSGAAAGDAGVNTSPSTWMVPDPAPMIASAASIVATVVPSTMTV